MKKSVLPHHIFVKIQTIYPSLKSGEQGVADYIMEHAGLISKQSLSSIAECVQCSAPTVLRLIKKLDYDSYNSFKDDLILNNKNALESVYSDFTKKDEPTEILRKVFSSTIQAIEDTVGVIAPAAFSEAVNVIEKAGKVLCIGAGDVSMVAQIVCYKFLSIGYDFVTAQDFDLQLIYANQLGTGDAIIVISHTGRSKNVLEVAKQARARGAKVISITNYAVSPLVKNSDIILQTATFCTDMNGEIIAKRIAELCIIEGIYVSLLLRSDDKKAILTSLTDDLQINKL